MQAKVIILFEGYNRVIDDHVTLADGSSTLVQTSSDNILVDTLGPWNKDKLLESLASHGLHANDITHVIGTHGHPDHIGNLNLFTNPKTVHVVATSVYQKDQYFNHNFDQQPYEISAGIQVQATPGHTHSCVSLICDHVSDKGRVAIVGDLFERQEDLTDESIWMNVGSECPDLQRLNRSRILAKADYIVPGHGSLFRVVRSTM